MAANVTVERIGQEGEPLAMLDDFAPDAHALRDAAMAATFVPGDHHYPGLRAALPEGYLRARMPAIAAAIGRAFGRCRRVEVVDASFSIVTTPPAALSLRQRVPHVDAFGRERLAMVHYLSPDGGDGTAFFRHRATEFETVDAGRAPAFFAALEQEVAATPPPAAYVAGDTPLFECIHAAQARFNRALLYRSYLLHSGAIAPDARLSGDPATGRLTVTAFFEIR